MAHIQKTYNSMGLPMNINRSNPIPVDSTEVWYSLEAAQNYAVNDARAYVGQILTVITGEGEAATSKAYIIQNTNGDLVEVVNKNTIPPATSATLGGVKVSYNSETKTLTISTV